MNSSESTTNILVGLILILFYFFLFKWIINKIKRHLKRQTALKKQKMQIEAKKIEYAQRKNEEDERIRQEALKKYEEIISIPYDNRIVKNIYNEKNNIKYRVVPRYRKKEFLMTNNELKFYKVLKEIADKYNCIIFSQVILYEILEVNTKENWGSRFTTLFNKINRKSIDFTICDNFGRILFCIELDDETHKRKKRKERDIFLDEIFEEANLELIHIKRRDIYDKTFIDKIFARMLKFPFSKNM